MAQGEIKTLTIANQTGKLQLVRGFVSEALLDCPVESDERNKLVLAVDEAVANVIEHGYISGAEGEILISVQLGEGFLRFTIQDWGQSFDPRQVEVPDLERHVREGRRGGLGIFLIRQIMDEINYESTTEEGNRLVLVKYFT